MGVPWQPRRQAAWGVLQLGAAGAGDVLRAKQQVLMPGAQTSLTVSTVLQYRNKCQ